jgi:hypothetical protein
MINKGLIKTLIEKKPNNVKISIPYIYSLIIIYKFIENFKGNFITDKPTLSFDLLVTKK